MTDSSNETSPTGPASDRDAGPVVSMIAPTKREIVICLVIGVVITLGTAWGFGAFGDAFAGESFAGRRSWPARTWDVTRSDGVGVTVIDSRRHRYDDPPGETSDDPYAVSVIPPEDLATFGGLASPQTPFENQIVNGERRTVMASGWPLRAMWSEGAGESIEGGIAFTLPGQDRVRALPLRPVVLGFAANVAIYASAIWLFVCLPLHRKRAFRLAENLCPRCAYPIGKSDRCTECGSVIKAR